jgi:probable O-glycosylation ligase (exosortase A-associated)
MLRLTLVLGIIFVGAWLALQAPFYALLFYLWNAYFRAEVWVWLDLIARLDLSFWIGLVLVVSFLSTTKELYLDRRMAVCLLFLAQSLVSTVFSQAPAVSWKFLVDFSEILLITYLIVELVTDLPRLRLTLLVIAFSLGLEGAKQGWATMILHPGGLNNNPVPFLGNNNDVATGMLMLVPMFGALVATAGPRWEKLLHRFFLVGVLYRALSTYSRSGFLAASALGAIYVVRARRRFIAIASTVVVALGLSLVLSSGYWQRMDTITEGTETKDESILSRFHFWEVAVRMGTSNPLTGCGFGAYAECYDRYDFSHGEYGSRREPHSSWFGVFADQGYPGLAVYVAIFGSALLSCRRVRRLARAVGDREIDPYAAGLEASLWALAVCSTFHSYLYNEMAWHFFGLTIALERIASERAVALAVEEGAPEKAETSSFDRAVAFRMGSP